MSVICDEVQLETHATYLIHKYRVSKNACQIRGVTKKMRVIVCKSSVSKAWLDKMKIRSAFRNCFFDKSTLDLVQRHIDLPVSLRHIYILEEVKSARGH